VYRSVQLTTSIGAVAVAFCLCVPGAPVGAQDDEQSQAVLNKAIKALGGAEKLQAKILTWKVKDPDRTGQITVQNPDQIRYEQSIADQGKTIKSLTIINGDKGWSQIDDKVTTLKGEELLSSKHWLYKQVIPVTILPLKGKGFKLKAVGEQKVDGKPAVGIQVTPPGVKTGGEFTLYFDKESGLPAKMIEKIDYGDGIGENIFADYKEFDGIKKAMKIQMKPGDTIHISEFKVLDKVDARIFSEPK
jgi:hypothetical protein